MLQDLLACLDAMSLAYIQIEGWLGLVIVIRGDPKPPCGGILPFIGVSWRMSKYQLQPQVL